MELYRHLFGAIVGFGSDSSFEMAPPLFEVISLVKMDRLPFLGTGLTNSCLGYPFSLPRVDLQLEHCTAD